MQTSDKTLTCGVSYNFKHLLVYVCLHGLKRYGYHRQSGAEGIFAAASYFESRRMPELLRVNAKLKASLCLGCQCSAGVGCWSDLLIRTILGLEADAPINC